MPPSAIFRMLFIDNI